MALRKWVVRSVVFALLAVMTAAGFAYHYWTNPIIVRQKVLARLRLHLPSAAVTLESARLSLFGGIPFTDLRLMERADPTAREGDRADSEFAHIPSGAIYYDKEQLHKGKLFISKIEGYRPTLHIIRHCDGTWNVRKVLPTPDPRKPVPIIQFQHATVFFEDQRCPTGLAPLVIKDVNLKILNDPLTVLTFSGSGVSDLLGKVELRKCTLARATEELTLELELPDVPLDRTLLKRFSAYLPEAAERAGDFSARAALHARIHYQPQPAGRWEHDVTCRIRQGRLLQPEIPLPLESIEADIHCQDGLVTLKSTARAGNARLTLTGQKLGPAADADLDGSLRVEHLDVAAPLLGALPARLQQLEADYRPRGPVGLTLDFCRRRNRWRQHCLVQPEDLRMLCTAFPYPLEHVTGTIEHEMDAENGVDRQKLRLTGYTGRQPVHVEADIQSEKGVRSLFRERPATTGPQKGPDTFSTINLHIWGRDIPLDARLKAALQEEYQRLVEKFDPRGLGDFDAVLTRAPGEPHLTKRFHIRFHDVALRFRQFPYPLESVAGLLDIEPDHWEFRDFHGRHKGGDFYSHGRSDSQARDGFTATITGKQVLLDPEMQAALQQEGLKRAWVNLAPAGRMDFEAQVVKEPNGEPDVDVKVTALGCRFRPAFFPYTLNDVHGQIQYHRGQIELKQLSARHDLTTLGLLSGKVFLKPTGGVSVNLYTVSGDPLVPDEEFLAAMPPLLRQACAALRLHDPLTLLVHLVIDLPADPGGPPYVYWDGGIRLRDASLWAGTRLDHVSGQLFCRGEHRDRFGDVRGYLDVRDVTVFGQRLQDLQTPLAVSAAKPYQLRFPDIKAHLFGGDLVGDILCEFHPVFRYEINLTGSDLKLEDFALINDLGPKASMSGLAAARLYLTGQGSDFRSLEGGGSIDVPNGKIYNNLPFLLDLIKMLNLRAPDRTAFEEAHVRFDWHGDHIQVNQVDLVGNAISLSGKGSLKVDGTDLNLDFYPLWGRIMQWSPRGFDKIPPLISQSLFKIKMRGSLAHRETIRELVPPVVEPVKGLLKTMSRANAGETLKGSGVRNQESGVRDQEAGLSHLSPDR
jgi:hypothetical protein